MLLCREKNQVKKTVILQWFHYYLCLGKTLTDLKKTRDNTEEKGDKHRSLKFKHVKE